MTALIGIHAAVGELGAIMFIWAFIEIINPTSKRIKRAQLASFLGMLFFIVSWIVGGYYYVEFYGSLVKPIIKSGPLPWAHSVVTETKEHVFLFLPFLSVLAFGLITKYKDEIENNVKIKNALKALLALIILIGFGMAFLGFLITSGFRSALETLLV